MGSALMIVPLVRVVVHNSRDPCGKFVQENLQENFRNRTVLESWISRGLLKLNLAKKPTPREV
jgi:hypothetical protein